jgi:hypothetical protein
LEILEKIGKMYVFPIFSKAGKPFDKVTLISLFFIFWVHSKADSIQEILYIAMPDGKSVRGSLKVRFIVKIFSFLNKLVIFKKI